jgi:hypothetical protein
MSKIKDKIEDEKEFANKETEASEPKDEYRFSEKGHRHELLVDDEWKSLTGCTTILGVIAKPMLIQWSANMAVEYINENLSLNIFSDPVRFQELLKEAKTAHRRKKEEAGQKGTDIHSEVEKLVASVIGAWGGIIDKDTKSEFPQVQHFINWAVENKVKFLETEKGLYSKSLFLGGIVDLLFEIEGEVWVGDIKTGSGIYPEHFAQMAGYELMLKEMGFDREIKGHIVLNLKKDGTFQEKRSVSTEDAKNFFLACVSVYRLQEKFNNQII